MNDQGQALDADHLKALFGESAGEDSDVSSAMDLFFPLIRRLVEIQGGEIGAERSGDVGLKGGEPASCWPG